MGAIPFSSPIAEEQPLDWLCNLIATVLLAIYQRDDTVETLFVGSDDERRLPKPAAWLTESTGAR